MPYMHRSPHVSCGDLDNDKLMSLTPFDFGLSLQYEKFKYVQRHCGNGAILDLSMVFSQPGKSGSEGHF